MLARCLAPRLAASGDVFNLALFDVRHDLEALDQERAARGEPRKPDYLPALQRELARVVSKYVKVPAGDVQVQMQRRHDSKQVLEVKVRLPQAAR
jgi:cell division topological specificity factor MinE